MVLAVLIHVHPQTCWLLVLWSGCSIRIQVLGCKQGVSGLKLLSPFNSYFPRSADVVRRLCGMPVIASPLVLTLGTASVSSFWARRTTSTLRRRLLQGARTTAHHWATFQSTPLRQQICTRLGSSTGCPKMSTRMNTAWRCTSLTSTRCCQSELLRPGSSRTNILMFLQGTWRQHPTPGPYNGRQHICRHRAVSRQSPCALSRGSSQCICREL